MARPAAPAPRDGHRARTGRSFALAVAAASCAPALAAAQRGEPRGDGGDEAHGRSEWRVLFEDDSTRVAYFPPSVRRTAPGRLAMYHRLTFPEQIGGAVAAVEIDCAAARGRVWALDVYAGAGGRESRVVADPAWGPAQAGWALAACERLLSGAPAGHVSELTVPRPPSRWRLLATGANGDAAFVDAETLVRRPGAVSAWVRTVRGGPGGGWSGRVAAHTRHWTLDCRAGRYRLGQWATYDATGTVVRAAASPPTAWGVPLPDTVDEQLLQGLCARRALPEAPSGQFGPDPE